MAVNDVARVDEHIRILHFDDRLEEHGCVLEGARVLRRYVEARPLPVVRVRDVQQPELRGTGGDVDHLLALDDRSDHVEKEQQHSY